VQQYYYVNQGPTYTGPGNWAPYPTYQEGAVSGWDAYHRHPYHYGYDGGRYAEGPVVYRYHGHHWRPHTYRYGYTHRYYGHRYGYREHVLRRYY
jgi:hypothetical protein